MPKYQFDVEVQPQYLPEHSHVSAHVFRFAYTITITNAGDMPAQVISRHWVISDSNGHTEEVKGLGVVGQQPLLKPGESFQYSSGCQLHTPSGTMHGSYFCMAEDGTPFTSTIPLFILEAQDPSAPEQPLGPRVLH
ncbi:Co2+/Mg2+ efflux protein ApaG [Simplicispira psychrophila]|uniref:Co2+/Mg2+ efflux protein ApaG n=1 Tax=Simplicispira psychrophila TaxID=80882 RepID=UPI0004821CE4|nr:Co2+/Mg2+ efflux protein ApaG [Simplicispira psychrophila]